MPQGSSPPPLPPRPNRTLAPAGSPQSKSGGPSSPLSPKAALAAPPPLGRDLRQIAQLVLAFPSIGKKILHSKFLSSHRSAVQSPGAAGSYVASGMQKGVSAGLSAIPLPVVGTLLDKAWTAACEALRSKLHSGHLTATATPEERVKFELKDLGDTVGEWDRYRWKVAHAVEEYNKAARELQQNLAKAPCDAWVRMWVKYLYLEKRVRVLRESVEAVRGILDETDGWLVTVETNHKTAYQQIESQFKQSGAQLQSAGMAAHEKCSDTKCMFKKASWTSSALVPTSETAKFLVKGVSVVANVLGNDPIGDSIDQATQL